MSSRSRAAWSRPCRTRCSASSWPTVTAFWRNVGDERAESAFGRALTLADSCGADVLRAAVASTMTGLGIAVPTGPRDRLVLTVSERRIAELAADGVAFPDIAQSLFVTTRTVSTIVRSVSERLGAATTEELRAGLAGLGIVSTVIAGATLFVGMRRLPPATAALVATLEPVLTLIWAMTILDESLVALQFVGAALVVAGVVWSQRTSPVVASEPG